MNSSKCSKFMKRKAPSTIVMGQKNATSSNLQSSCSIFSVDEGVQYVIDNKVDETYSPTIPLDTNLELSRKTYSRRKPLSLPAEPFQFSDIPDLGPMASSSLNCTTSVRFPQKRGPDGKFVNIGPRKILRTNRSGTNRSSELKSKEVHVENDASSDSDIEIVEVKLGNPQALNTQSRNNALRRSLKRETDNSNKKKIIELSKIKPDLKPIHQISKSSYIATQELIVNEADTAPFMPSNPKNFPDDPHVPDTFKWLNANSDVESSHSHNAGEEAFLAAGSNLSLQQEADKCVVKTLKKKRELKNLIDNLEEISWTRETKFKKLMQNPEYIRHSDRSTGRCAGSGKVLRKVKQVSKKPISKSIVKKFPLMKASLKKSKIVKQKLIKKLAKVTPKAVSKEEEEEDDGTRYMLPKLKTCKKSEVISKDSKKGSNVKVSKKSAKVSELKNKSLSDKVKKMNLKKGTKLKNLAKRKLINSKVKTKIQTNKTKKNKNNPSSSGSLSALSKKKTTNDTVQSSHDKEISNQKTKLAAKRLKMLQDYKKKDSIFSIVPRNSQCRVQLEPVECTTLWRPEYFDDYQKHFLHKAIRSAMEERDPSNLPTLFQEYCDTYSTPIIEDKNAKTRKPDEESLRSSARHIGGSLRYKEIVVKKMKNYMNIILVPNNIKKNALSIDGMKELRDAFQLAKKDPKCKAILINSSGSYFCSGLDLSQLLVNKKQVIEEMASVVKELVLVLSSFTKPVVAAVNGATSGFGVSLLVYCDIVFASDKATFCIPSPKMGYVPEGGITITLSQIIGNTRCCDMLLQGSTWTAAQAYQKGLVTEVLWPSKFMNEVMPRFLNFLAQPLHIMETTKLLMRSSMTEKLQSHMEAERSLLVTQWSTPECQDKIRRFLREHQLIV